MAKASVEQMCICGHEPLDHLICSLYETSLHISSFLYVQGFWFVLLRNKLETAAVALLPGVASLCH